jgi:hypothetical protein
MHPRDVRASDLDRERAVEFLKAHYTAGRLQHDELAWRTDAAYRAVRIAELDWLTSDLPAAAPPARRRRLSPVRVVVIAVLLIALLTLVPHEAWLIAAAVMIPFAILAFVSLLLIAPIALPVLLIAGVVQVIARAARPRSGPLPRQVGWR